MQVVVQHIDTKVPGPYDAQQGVHVGPITIDQAATAMDEIDYLSHLLFEQPKRIGIGQHQPGDIRATVLLEFFKIDIATIV